MAQGSSEKTKRKSGTQIASGSSLRDARRASAGDAEHVIRVHDDYYVLASSSLADSRTRALKQGEAFAVFDRFGDINPVGRGEQGLYRDGTRFLNRLELAIGGERPLLLSSTVKDNNGLVAVDLANSELNVDGCCVLPQHAIHIFRGVVLWQDACTQYLRVRNYCQDPVRFQLTLRFDADFSDIFEVRGMKRTSRGRVLPAEITENEVCLGYVGLDGVTRRVRLWFSLVPNDLKSGSAEFEISLASQAEQVLTLRAHCECGEGPIPHANYGAAVKSLGESLKRRAHDMAGVYTSNEQFNAWVNRSVYDLRMMLTETPHGVYPYAGIPWFNAPFGRDGIITALETLWVAPSIAAGVLRFLAANQAQSEDPANDAEPGKILHEARGGEMAALSEVPFRRYYGSIDSTPLFMILAHAYYQNTGDLKLIEEIWPSLLRAFDWIVKYGDLDGDGLVEYARRSPTGLVNQGWKDSHDSVFHADGTLAEGPIALCEVQAYAFGARRALAALATAMGDADRARNIWSGIADFRRHFEEKFWSPRLRTYFLALDGEKRPCAVRTSNAGHCLYTGLASAAHARVLAKTLMEHDSFCGWGVRTLSAKEPCYNPMSYHNGSVWPHDNALIAAGMARYGLKLPVLRILAGLFDASLFVELHRMPELFCGFRRRSGEGPTLYPVACIPQSWAAGSVFLLLQSCFGLELSAPEQRVMFRKPALPAFLERVEIHNLKVGEATLDITLHRHPEDVGVQVKRRTGDVSVEVIK